MVVKGGKPRSPRDSGIRESTMRGSLDTIVEEETAQESSKESDEEMLEEAPIEPPE